MRRAILVAALLTACGDVHSADNLGDPIFRVHARLEGAALPVPEGEARALFGWLSIGTGTFVDCLEENPLLECGVADYTQRLTLFGTPVTPEFPSGLEVPLWTYPEPDALLERNGAKFAFGGLAIYDDRNLNGELDRLDPQDVNAIDQLVAESVVSKLRSAVVFREGPLHPIWRVFKDLVACPDPPQGLSVAAVDENNRCSVGPMQPLIVNPADNDKADRWLCGGELVALPVLRPSEEPLEPPPADAAGITCVFNDQRRPTRLSFYLDKGHYCDKYSEERIYSLKGCSAADPNHCWDYRDNPPAWWPCR